MILLTWRPSQPKKNFYKAQSINIPNNCHRFWIILVLIDSHHKHGSISWGGWNDDLFGPALQVSAGLFCRCENTSWLNNIFSTAFTPWYCAWVSQCIDKDFFAIYDKLAIFCLNSSLESSMSGVVLINMYTFLTKQQKLMNLSWISRSRFAFSLWPTWPVRESLEKLWRSVLKSQKKLKILHMCW